MFEFKNENLFLLFSIVAISIFSTDQSGDPSLLSIDKYSNSTNKTMKIEWKVLIDGTVTHQDFNYKIERKFDLILGKKQSKCQKFNKKSLNFVIMVISNAIHFKKRNLIRETWGLNLMQQLGNYQVFFLVGQNGDNHTQEKLVFENMIYDDIIQIDTEESFYNLTLKSIYMLKWYTEYCSKADFLMKTDDDIYLHLPSIRKILNSSHMNNTILCHENKTRKILRNINDTKLYTSSWKNFSEIEAIKKFEKYFVKIDDLPGILYPKYCSGFNYVFNTDVAKKLLDISKTIPHMHIEDVFITGFCRHKANITIRNSPNFKLDPIFPIESRCTFDTGRINSNEMSEDEIRMLWLHINTQGYYCKLLKN